jgi:citrate synthase
MTLATKGLEGVTAASSSISSIENGVLTYRGYSIDDLAENASFEEVIYLLWHGKLPTYTELKDFQSELIENIDIPNELIEYQMKSFPIENVHPMTMLGIAVSTLAIFDEEANTTNEEANYRKAIRLQAKIPTIVAALARVREGLEPVKPKRRLSLAGNFLYMLTGKVPDETSEKAFDKALVLHADHEFNASTFAARVCIGTLSDLYSGATVAIGTLKGPLHGGANEAVMKMLREIGEVNQVESYIQNAFENKNKIMGFGHRVYKNGDPRAKFLREMSMQLAKITGESKWYDMSVKIEKLVKEEKELLPNVDFYSASVYHSLGINQDLFTPIFAISRMSGWLAHIMEQYTDNRLIRPRSEYIGEKNRTYLPIHHRF